MDLDYDIFENLNGWPLWRDYVKGLRNAMARLQQLAMHSTNELFAMHTPTKKIVARVNVPGACPSESSQRPN